MTAPCQYFLENFFSDCDDAISHSNHPHDTNDVFAHVLHGISAEGEKGHHHAEQRKPHCGERVERETLHNDYFLSLIDNIIP